MSTSSRILALVLTLGLLAAPAASAQSYLPEALPAPVLDGFARAVAVGDGAVFVGEAGNDYAPGTVYVYRRGADGAWTEAAQLTADDAADSDGFGRSLAYSDGRLAVGSRGPAGDGAVYVFEEGADGAWTQAARLTVDADDAFGATVALDGDNLLVGAPSREGGAVHAFRRVGGTWTESGALAVAEDAMGFGAAIGIAGTHALVGAPMAGDGTGAVYAYTWEGDAWTGGTPVVASAGDRAGFGSAVAVAGDEALVGAPGAAERAGAVYTYTWDETEGAWNEQRRLVAFDAGPNYRFGTSVAFDGDQAWIGAPGAARLAGTAYVVRRDGDDGDWLAAEKLKADALHTRDFFASSLAAMDGLAVVGVTGADYGAGAAVIFEHDAEAAEVGTWQTVTTLRSEPRGLPAMTGDQTLCEEGAAGRFACEDVDLLAFMPIDAIGGGRGVRLNDIWGWVDPQTGKEYALVGRIDGTSFVDISDPYNPIYVGTLPRTEGTPAASWRDIKVYQDHAYVVADASGEHGMQVLDLTQLRRFDGEPITFEPTAWYDRINSAHNIVINEDSGFAYAVGASAGGETCGGGLHMINIQDPANPTFAGCFSDPTTGRAGTGYSHDAQCVIYQGPDADYRGREICLGSNETALSIADVTDKENPVALSTADYPNVAYTHQGWLTDDHRYFYVNDELDELQQKVSGTRTLIWDVTDLNDPQLVKEYFFGSESSDHNLYIRGNLMYQSNYASGLRIHDISDPENPRVVGHFDTVPVGDDGPGFSGSWSNFPFFQSGVIAVSSIGEGLFLVRRKSVDI